MTDGINEMIALVGRLRVRDSDAMLARKAAGFEPRSGRSAGRKASPKGYRA